MTIVAANWVGENTSTVGTGPLALSGAIRTFCPFSVLPDGSEVYYTLQEGFNRETGIGVVSNGTLTRKVQATLVAGVYTETDIPISLSGNGQVFAVINADFMTRIYNFSLDVADSVSAAAASASAAASSQADALASKNSAKTSETNAKASETAAKTSENNAKASELAAENARDQVQQIINDAGEQLTLVALAQRDGFKNVGQVPSFAALRSVIPAYAGQRILLKSYYENGTTGGGEFEAVYGTAVDDGGHLCVVSSSVYWRRVSSEVRTSDYGIFSQSISASSKVDHSVKLQNAINRAKALLCPLVSELGNENHHVRNGIYLESGIDITGIKSIKGALPLIVDSSVFTGITAVGYPGITWVLTNLNANYGSTGMIFGTAVGNQLIDSITIRDFNARSAPLGGQLHTFSGTIVKGSLCATGFNGPGVYLASCYDSSIQDIRAIYCGNTSYWGIYIDSYPADSTSKIDNSNHLTIGSIEPHDCYDKSLNSNPASSFIGHIHEERTFVTDTSPWSSATIYTNGFGWTNTILAGDWTTYGSVRVLPDSATAANHVVTVVANQVDICTLNAVGNVGIHFSYTTPRRGVAIGTLDVAYKLYVTEGVYGKIAHCQVIGADSEVTILKGGLNFGSMIVPGASSTLNASGCVFEYIKAVTATLSYSTVLCGNFVALTTNWSCNIANIGAETLVMSGSRNSLKDAYISLTSTFSGDGVVSGCALIGASKVSGSYTMFGIKTNANMTIDNSTAQTYHCVLRDSYVNGQLNIFGYTKVKVDAVSVVNLNLSLTAGYILLNDVQMSGAIVGGNTIASTNTPTIGSMTQDPSTGKSYIYKSTGWKEITTAA